MRYGIKPTRVKVAIWFQQHFLEEVLPQMNPQMMYASTMLDQKMEEVYPSKDYGLDLKEMELDFIGEDVDAFPVNMLPKNLQIQRDMLNMKEMRANEKKIHPSMVKEESLFGSKLKTEEKEASPQPPVKVEDFKQVGMISNNFKKSMRDYLYLAEFEFDAQLVQQPKGAH